MKSIAQRQSIFFILIFLLFACMQSAQIAQAENIVEPPKTIPKLLKEAAINLEQKTLAPEYKLVSSDQDISLKDYLYYFVDTKAVLGIKQITNATVISDFSTVYDIKAQGTTWVRLLLAPFDLVGDEIPFFDVGENIQGEKNVWLKPKYLDAVQKKANENGYFSIEELRHGGEIYIAIQGLPSIWFEPRFVSADTNVNTVKNIEMFLTLFLLLITLFALLTAFLSKKTWRIALSVFALSCLAIQYFGLPVTPKGQIIPSDIATLFAVSVALFSLHIVFKGKLKTAENAKVLDIFFLLTGVLGLFLPFLVLIPSFAWCVRYIELWQIYSFVYFLLIFPLLFKGVYASLLCLFANFLLFLSVAFALAILSEIEILSYFNSFNLDTTSLFPLIGQILALLLLVISKDESYSAVKQNKKLKKRAAFLLAEQESETNKKNLRKSEIQSTEQVQEEVKDKNSAFLIKTEESKIKIEEDEIEQKIEEENQTLESEAQGFVHNSEQAEKEVEKHENADYVHEKNNDEENALIYKAQAISLTHEEQVEAKFSEIQLADKLDTTFRPSLENMMREICFLENKIKDNSSIEELMQKTDNIAAFAKDISTRLKELPYLLKDEQAFEKKQKKNKQRINEAFDLEELIKEVYARLRRLDSSEKIALSWIKAPHVGKFFVGDKEYFGELLFDLLADSIRATEKGSVYLRVQRDACSNNPGRLSFILGDSGRGKPPYKRSASLLNRIWEMSSDYYGDFYAEQSANGLEYSFTLSFIALEDDGKTEKLVSGYNTEKKTRFEKVLLISENPKQKYMLSFRLSNIECHVLEAMNIEDAYRQFMEVQPALIIVDDTVEKDQLLALIQEIQYFEREYQVKQAILLGLYSSEDEKIAFEEIGCHTTLALNEGREGFRNLVQELLIVYRATEVLDRALIEEASEQSKELTENSKESLKFIPVAGAVKSKKEKSKFKFFASKSEKAKSDTKNNNSFDINIEDKKQYENSLIVESHEMNEELILNPSMVSYETLPEEKDKI